MIPHRKVIENFLLDRPGPRGYNLFVENGVLFSHGRHWPLARKCGTLVHVNQEHSLVSTNHHATLVSQVARQLGLTPLWSLRDECVAEGHRRPGRSP